MVFGLSETMAPPTKMAAPHPWIPLGSQAATAQTASVEELAMRQSGKPKEGGETNAG